MHFDLNHVSHHQTLICTTFHATSSRYTNITNSIFIIPAAPIAKRSSSAEESLQRDESPRRPEHLHWAKKLLFTYEIHNLKTCMTAFDASHLATFAHHPHEGLVVGSEISVTALLENIKVECQVVARDDRLDLVILHTNVPVLETPPLLLPPYEADDYFQLGLSAVDRPESPFSITDGVFISREWSRERRHYLGSGGSNKGDSGGPCVCKLERILFGIVVGNDNVALHERTPVGELFTRYPARAHIIPSMLLVETMECRGS
jgi:hypothetical protein